MVGLTLSTGSTVVLAIQVQEFSEGPDYDFQYLKCGDGVPIRKSWDSVGGPGGLEFFINEELIAVGWEPSILEAFQMWEDSHDAISFEYQGSTAALNETFWNADGSSGRRQQDGMNVVSMASNMPARGVGGFTVGCPGGPLSPELSLPVSDTHVMEVDPEFIRF